jgi:hypothetical protein
MKTNGLPLKVNTKELEFHQMVIDLEQMRREAKLYGIELE